MAPTRARAQPKPQPWSWSRTAGLRRKFEELCRSLDRCEAAKLPDAIAAALEQLRTLPIEPISEKSMAGCPMFFGAPEEWRDDLIAGRSQPRLAIARLLFLLSPSDRSILERVSSCPDLRSLEGLRVAHPENKPLEIEALAVVAPKLRWLRLDSCGIDERGARALSKMPFDRLEALYLAKNPLGPAGAAALVQLRAPHLRWLDLHQTAAGPETAAALADSPLPERLEVLVLSDDAIGDPGLSVLARRGHWGALRRLCLNGNEIGDLEALAGSSMVRNLEALELSANPIGDRGLAVLCSISSLRELSLYDCGIGPSGARALASSELRLRSLRLCSSPVGDEGVAALAASPALSEVRRLELVTVGLTDAGVRALAAAPWISQVKDLDLEQHTDAITGQGWKALSAAMKRKRRS